MSYTRYQTAGTKYHYINLHPSQTLTATVLKTTQTKHNKIIKTVSDKHPEYNQQKQIERRI